MQNKTVVLGFAVILETSPSCSVPLGSSGLILARAAQGPWGCSSLLTGEWFLQLNGLSRTGVAGSSAVFVIREAMLSGDSRLSTPLLMMWPAMCSTYGRGRQEMEEHGQVTRNKK